MDAIIKNVRIIDGTGREGFEGEVGISGDVIASVAPPGKLAGSRAALAIDGRGAVLSPGFIDIHSHDDVIFWDDPYDEPKLRQGVTTVAAGMCGSSPYPLPEAGSALMDDILKRKKANCPAYPWTAGSLEEYASQLEDIPPGVNIVPVAGHGSLRLAVMGYRSGPPSAEELRRMKILLAESMEAGAAGMSTGLIYPPGSYAGAPEIKELAGVVGGYGGIYFTHLRSESAGMLEALEEAEKICSGSGVRLHISHLKCHGRDSWKDARTRLARLEKIREGGIEVSWDQYPYTASSTGLLSLLPPSVQENGLGGLIENLDSRVFRDGLTEEIKAGRGSSWENAYRHAGGWERIVLCGAPGFEELEGKTIAELAGGRGEDPFLFVYSMIRDTRGAASMVVFSMDPEDVETILAHPSTCVGSDGTAVRGKGHPRMFGTFARVIGRYAREKKLLTLEEAVFRMTGMPAAVLGLKDRGEIRKGFKADLTLFNPETIRDTATYAAPRSFPEGVIRVFVNGRTALAEGKLSEERCGSVLLRA